MSSDQVKELLRQGIEAAKANKREEARKFFQEVVDLDEENERGWFWLATVVDSDEERRICLLNVLRINPNNERAEQALQKLDERRKQTGGEDEVVAGVSRRQFTLLIGAAAAIVIGVLVIFLISSGGNNAAAAAATRAAQAPTQTVAAAETQAALAALTEEALAADQTATALAINSPTPTATRTPFLPDVPTETPLPTDASNLPTLPPPTGLIGRLFGWSGRDIDNDGYLQIAVWDLALPGEPTIVSDVPARFPSYDPNRDRIIFTRYFAVSFGSGLQVMSTTGTDLINLSDFWNRTDIVVGATNGVVSPDGNRVAFVAEKNAVRDVYILDISTQDLTQPTQPASPDGTSTPLPVNPLRQLTSDGAHYSYPAWSADGTRLVVVRDTSEDVDRIVQPDLIVIDVASGAQTSILPNGSAFFEISPRFTADNRTVIFSAAASRDPGDHDILSISADGTGAQTVIVGQAGVDELYPTLSPDGTFLAYAANPTGLQYDIYIRNIATGETFQLTDSREDDFPGHWAGN